MRQQITETVGAFVSDLSWSNLDMSLSFGLGQQRWISEIELFVTESTVCSHAEDKGRTRKKLQDKNFWTKMPQLFNRD